MLRPLAGLASLLAISPWLLSCVVQQVQRGGLPDYGRARVFEPSPDEITELVRYRQLSRADFRAEAPRADMAAHAKEVGAYTCVLLPPRVEGEIDVEYDDSAGHYVARIQEAHFFATMDPDCSWWNDSNATQPPEYVLEHEQIHFMLAEIEARKIRSSLVGLELEADSRTDAVLGLQDRIDAAVRKVTGSLLEVANRFDEDTSARYAPKKQAEWLALAEAELERLPASPAGAFGAPASDAAPEPL